MPSDAETEPFNMPPVNQSSTARESAAQRTESFKQVYKTGAWGKGWDPDFKDLNGSGRGRSSFSVVFYLFDILFTRVIFNYTSLCSGVISYLKLWSCMYVWHTLPDYKRS